MSKIVVPSDIQGKELFQFLVANKSELIAQKKAFKKKCDSIGWYPQAIVDKGGISTKVDMGEIPTDANEINAEVVANTSMWLDSQKDVLLKNSGAASIAQRLKAGLIKQLKDHGDSMDDQIGDVKDVFYQDYALRDLGLPKTGSAQALVVNFNVVKSYDAKTFEKYKRGVVNQHSIGLYYVKIDLAINDSEYGQEFDLWNRHINNIINQDDAEKSGYFWAVSEYKLIENSAVLFGANSLTPTLSTGAKNTHDAPPDGTHYEPLKESYFGFDVDRAFKQTKFF